MTSSPKVKSNPIEQLGMDAELDRVVETDIDVAIEDKYCCQEYDWIDKQDGL